MKPKDTNSDGRPSLEREKVVTVALELLDEVGFEGLTLRKLAERLHVKAAALYWHFENKQDLVDQLAGRIFEEEFRSKSGDEEARQKAFEQADWRTVLLMMGKGMRSALRRHRDGAVVVVNANLAQSKSFRGRAMMMQKLIDEGFDMELVFSSMFAVVRFTLGCVFEEQADPRSRQEQVTIHKRRMDEIIAECPGLATRLRNMPDGLLYDADRQFETGLNVILDGIEQQLARLPR